MAQGTFLLFNAINNYRDTGVVDLLGGTWRVILCSDPVTSLLVSETNPAKGSTNINEVTNGGGYSTGGILITTDNTDTGGVFTFKLNTTTHPSGVLAWTLGAGSPTNIKSAVLYDDAATSPVDAAVGFWDMTEDGGTTALSLVARDINLNVGAADSQPGVIFTLPVNS